MSEPSINYEALNRILQSLVEQLNPHELAHLIVHYLLLYARHSEAPEFKAFFCGGIITNVVANLPEDYFEQLLTIKPCGRVGCDCHLLAEPAANFFRAIREDHQRYSGKLHPE
jgi:hypothetical protein